MMQWPFLLGVVQQEVRMCTANFGQVKFAKMVQGEDLSAKPYHLLKITVWGKQKKKTRSTAEFETLVELSYTVRKLLYTTLKLGG